MDRYEAYKDSGVEWIGDIPEGWAVSRLKSLLSDMPHALADGPFGSDMKSDEYQEDGVPITQLNNIKDGVHKDDSFKYVSEAKAATLASHYIYPGELLMAKMMPAGRTCIASSAYPKYILSSDSIRIVPVDDLDRRFLCYAANAYANIEAELMSTGTTRVRINLGIVRNMQFAIPPHETQQAIADYLDAKTAEVDALVADCEREVGLLREYRKAVISEAVTKGLDPDAPMKDSGVEWIGAIPTNWEARRIKSFLKLRDERNSLPLEEVNLISLYTDLGVVQHSDLEKTTGNKAMTADGYKLVYENDIVVNIILCWMGAIGMSSYNGVTSPAYDVYIPNEEVDPRYLHYLFRTTAFGGECYKAGRGIMAMRWRTYSDQFKAITVPFPPLQQQAAIADKLDNLTEQTEALIRAKQSMADKLREYRKSLISEAVTGKFKVPGVS